MCWSPAALALRFDNARPARPRAGMPVVVNLFGAQRRVAAGLGVRPDRVRELGEMLAALREPAPVDGLKDALSRWPMVRAALSTRPQIVSRPPCQEIRLTGADVDLGRLPVQTCWPGEPAPLITWPLVITRPPDTDADDSAHTNVGVYRMQTLGKDRAILRWLHHRGGAAHHRAWAMRGQDMPVAVAIGAIPRPFSPLSCLPETLSELRFSGVLRGERPRLARCASVPLVVPADSEIVIEGYASAAETAPEGPGDHRLLQRGRAFSSHADHRDHDAAGSLYLSTFTGRPPDEPSVIGSVFNDLALPMIRRQIPEVVDVWLPPEACSYRMAVVSIAKRYPGQARRAMMALWECCRSSTTRR